MNLEWPQGDDDTVLQRSSSHSPVPTNPPLQITKGKVHGSIDVRLSVMSINKKAQRIDLDTEDNIYHLKIKSQDLFQSWVSQLRAHRLAQRSDLPNATHRKAPGTQTLTAGSASALPGVGSREKVSSWLRDSDGLDRCSHALSECQGKLQELHRLLQSLESLHRIPSAPVIPTHQVRTRGAGRECSGPLIPITSWGQACLLRTCPAVFRRFLCSICLDYCQHAAPLCPPGQSVRSSMVSPNSVTEITLQRARPQ